MSILDPYELKQLKLFLQLQLQENYSGSKGIKTTKLFLERSKRIILDPYGLEQLQHG